MDFPTGKKIILFDGVCNLCNGFVKYVIENDKNDIFRFASLQSEYGNKLQKYLGINQEKTDSIILYEPGIAYYTKSEAVVEIYKNLGGFKSIFAHIISVLPSSFSNIFYNIVAKNRYKINGKKQECIVPNQEIKAKFLE